MKRIVLCLVVMKFIFLAAGISVAFATPRLNTCCWVIHCYGTIASTDSQSSVGDSQEYIGERGYIPVFVGVGFLSVAFFTRLVERRVRVSWT